MTRGLMGAALLLLAGGCTMPPPEGGANPDAAPPNIVFVVADDLGIGDVGAYGSEAIKTPHIDALAESGVRFTQGYVSHPVCSPSRAGLMSGRYQQRHGWEFNPAGRDTETGMSTEEITFADAVKAQGYATGMVGKWHLGFEGSYHPVSRGFDEYFGVLAGGSLFIDADAAGVESLGQRGSVRQFPHEVYRGRETVAVDEYLTDRFTTEALDFITRKSGQPFLLYLSHTTPHTPLQATEKYLERYRHIKDKPTRIYAAMVASLDDSVGRIIERLKQLDQYENTLFVFLSDNGCAGYIGDACSNGPFAGYKRYHQEGGIRVPFIMAWPERLPRGTVYDKPVISLDLMATFSAAAGRARITEDSINLVPYLTGATQGSPHEYLYWRSGPTRAVRDGRWKLIQYARTSLTKDDLRSDGRLQPPDAGWPAEPLEGYLTLLYDLQNDPGESRNVAQQHPEIVQRLGAAYQAWNSELKTEQILPAQRSTLTNMHGETVQLIF